MAVGPVSKTVNGADEKGAGDIARRPFLFYPTVITLWRGCLTARQPA